MAAKQPAAAASSDGALASHVAGMSRKQLYDIMSQMKSLIEQNQQQARQILIDNPSLTKSLFQAQIMLGMVRPAKVPPSQQPLPSGHTVQVQKPIVPAQQPMHMDAGVHGEDGASQSQPVLKQQVQSATSLPPLTFQSQAIPSTTVPSSLTGKNVLHGQMPPISLGQSSQIHSLPPPPPPSLQQSSFHLNVPVPSSQMHHSIQSGKTIHQPLQTPMLPNVRPSSLQPFPHQLNNQFQPSNTSQLLTQPSFQPGSGPPTSFQQGQPPLPVQPPPQHLYQGGSQVGMDYRNQPAKPMQGDRVAPWAPGPADNAMPGNQFPGLPRPPMMNVGQSSQPPRLQQLSSEMEKALLQQVMSLTPEQINLLPPEQRQQVLQLQQMLR